MSLQWTLVACVMYVELAVTFLLLIPLISPARWHSLFKSKFLLSLSNMANFYFKVFLGILALLFADAIREMLKYSKETSNFENDHNVHLDSDMQAHMRLFRAQRNFYIAGFSLFLWIVLQRLVTLISKLAVEMAAKEAALKQARSASDAASLLLDDKKISGTKPLQEENKRLDAEYKAALKQAESVTKEYDRLLAEHSELQKKLDKATGSEPSKKHD